MAGIGFELRKLLLPGSYTGIMRAYFYAGVISCGPWIISILSIILLNLLLSPIVTTEERTLFSTTITHCYAIALILTGALQFVLNRYAADKISEGKKHRVFPSCVAALVLTAFISGAIGVSLFGFLTRETVIYKVGAIGLLVYVSLIFIASNYLSVLRKYRSVVIGFLLGYALACFAAWIGARELGISGALHGFALGHLLLLSVLLWNLQRQIGGSREIASWEFLGHFRKFPQLALCGLFYNLGIWVDKILFWWFSQQNIRVSGFMHASIAYDMSIYLSLLSIVPGLAVFFLRLETSFDESYQRFFKSTNEGGTLAEIVAAKRDMVATLRVGFSQLIAVQGIVTLSLLIFAERIGTLTGIGAIQTGIFRVTLVGAFLLILFLSMLTILFYLDDRKGALLCTMIFAFGNAGLSFLSLLANEAWYGFGFVVAAGAAMFVAALRVNYRIARFEYHVFLPQAA